MRYFTSILAFLCLVFSGSAYAQSKRPIVAIYQIEDLTGHDLSPTFSAMIETAITGTNKFRVMERAAVEKLLREKAVPSLGF